MDTCGGVFTPGAPAVCTFTYTGGNVQVEGTVLATQVYEYCDDIRCPRSLRGFAYVSLSTADGTQIASCFADAQLLIPGVPGICVGRGSPALPIGTELVCEGFSYSPGTFGCGRAVLP